jgi:membrane-bound lytic murein transglycosylase C
MKLLFIFAALLIIFPNSPSYAQSGVDSAFDELDKEVEQAPLQQEQMDIEQLRKRQEEMSRTLQRNMEEQEEEWGRLTREMEAQWNEMVARVHAQRELLRQRVEQLWDEFYDSTNKRWVDYSMDMDTRSIVDFENGEIEFSILIPVDQLPDRKQGRKEKAKKLAEEKIKKQMKKVLSSDNEVQTEVLKDQIKDPEGRTVTKENAEKFVEKYVAPEMQVEEKPVVAKDGVPRVKVKVRVKMVPEHLRIRAERYKTQVNKYAEKYGLDPALIYAVIHTESYFNPLAKSYIPAYGLMQLVPKSGAMDAYYYLHKKKKLLSPDYLYEPNNNIMLGATYFHVLYSIYLADIQDQSKRLSLSIAAYNWGPGNIKNKIVRKHEVDRLSNDEVIKLIDRVAPKETRDYIRRVKKRMALYRNM